MSASPHSSGTILPSQEPHHGDDFGRNLPVQPDDTLEVDPDAAEFDDDSTLEIDDAIWDALAPDDDYEPLPEAGDFWTDQDAA